jgi:D-3-phosphoglycerate dehydrogenase
MKVLVTCPPMLKRIDEYRDIFKRANVELITPDVVQILSEDELVEIVPYVDGWIIGDDPATDRVFTVGAKGKLKAAVKWGAGVDNVDFESCKRNNIPISNTPGMFGGEVADLAIAYMLSLARQTHKIDRAVREGKWIKPSGVSIAGKTVAVIGLGDIGKSVIKRLKGFEVDIHAYDPFLKLTAEELGIKFLDKFPDKIEQADFIILTCALTKSSYHIINADTMALMKDGVMLINVARGPLIDELALFNSLNSGKIASAALDVFEIEPVEDKNPILSYDQCIFGTHNGSNTKEAVARATNRAIEILFEFLEIKL